ncbi:MAG TPA: hypothetical protein VM580_15585 [Labilithrix sp.]|nr:hypothetical protein [Labilithrix sp.]
MWKRSFIGVTVALGDTVDDALAAIADGRVESNALPPMSSLPTIANAGIGAAASDLVAQLRAQQRATRAAALARVVRDVALAVDEGTLR